MLLRLFHNLFWAANFVAWIFILFMLGGCAQLREDLRSGIRPGLPCEANTCTADQLQAQDRDPIGDLISYGSIFGPQPEPGRVTVEAPK